MRVRARVRTADGSLTLFGSCARGALSLPLSSPQCGVTAAAQFPGFGSTVTPCSDFPLPSNSTSAAAHPEVVLSWTLPPVAVAASPVHTVVITQGVCVFQPQNATLKFAGRFALLRRVLSVWLMRCRARGGPTA